MVKMLRILGSGIMILFRVQGLDLGLGVTLWFGVWGFGLRVQGKGFVALGFGFRF
jgi:hypothetical protein